MLAGLLALAGCGDDEGIADGAFLDGGTDAGDVGTRATPPDIPWLDEGAPPIMLSPCPDGWREVTGGYVTECAPYPEGGAATCDPGQAHFPGEAACRPIGDPCPPGDYAAALPTDGQVIFVKEGAPSGGDGSRAAPHDGLSRVNWISLGAGTTVALGKGTYAGTLPLRAGVTVIGACTRDTVLTGLDGPAAAVLTVTSPGEPATVRNLSVVGAPQSGVIIENGRALNLEGVLFDRVTGVGLAAAGMGTVLTVSNTVVRGTQPVPGAGVLGRGADIEWGAHFEASRAYFADNHEFGIFAAHEGTSVTLTDVVVRDTRPQAVHRRSGNGIRVGFGAHLDGSRVLLTGNREAGALATTAGTVVTLSDSVIANTQPRASDDGMGRGLDVETGARFEGTRLVVAENREVGVFVGRERATVVLSDAVVRDTQPEMNGGGGGGGIRLQATGQLVAARLLLAANHQEGALFAERGTAATFTDVAIRDTLASAADGHAGRGISVQMGAHFEGSRLLLVNNTEVGFFAAMTDTTAELTDVVIRDTQAQPFDGMRGHGLQTQQGARVEATRLRIEDATALGILASSGSAVILDDLSIRRVRRSDCVTTTCPLETRGFGVAAVAATLDITGFEIRDAAICGVFVASPREFTTLAELDLSSGLVTESAIGACVQVDGYDLGRLTDSVEFRDNATRLESTTLPVPGVIQVPEI